MYPVSPYPYRRIRVALSVSTMAAEVDRPGRTFPVALVSAVCMASLGYLLSLMAATGAIDVPPEAWGDGFFADAAGLVAGRWLKYWIEVGAVLSSIGLYSTTLSSAAFLLLGLADLGFLPAFLAVRSSPFDTPWASILATGAIALGMSFFSFNSIVAAANSLYSLGMLLELAAFVWLRIKCPELPRPYSVPLGTAGVVAMCVVSSAFLVLIMAIAEWKVHVTSVGFTALGDMVYYLMAFCKARRCFRFSGTGDQEGEGQGRECDREDAVGGV